MKNVLCVLSIVWAVLAMPAWAGETRSAGPGHTPPPARIGDLSWLTGYWFGTGIDDDPAFETYSPATGGTILGNFAQMDDKGAIVFSEHVAISEHQGSLILRLKHFNSDLTGWEDKTQVVSFPLVALEPGAAFFDGLTLRRDGADGLLSAVTVRHEDGTLSEYVFRYKRTPLTAK